MDCVPVCQALSQPAYRSNPQCVTFVQQAQQAHKLLADLKALIQAGDTGAACALISKPENVKLRVAKGRRTLFADMFEGVLDDIEAFNEKRAELAMEELLREEGEKEEKQKERGRHGSKKSSKSKIPASTVPGMPPAASDVPTAPATALDHDDMQVAAALSGLLEQCGAEWSSTSPARLRQMLKDGGVDVAVSEKRMKRIKAWAVAEASVASGSAASCRSVVASCCAQCGKTEGELGAGEKLRKCGGCGVARYCSGACQKVAWSAGHKKECRN